MIMIVYSQGDLRFVGHTHAGLADLVEDDGHVVVEWHVVHQRIHCDQHLPSRTRGIRRMMCTGTLRKDGKSRSCHSGLPCTACLPLANHCRC